MDSAEIMGLKISDVTEANLKKAYKTLALKNHPDKFAGKSQETIRDQEEKFKEINEAYNYLLAMVKKFNW